MDTDAPQAPPFLGYFDVSSSGFAWKEPLPEQIERRRATMDDVLIFDILLTAGGIKQPREVFPPSDVDGLIYLLNTINDSQYDALKKECLIYLLLKWQQDGREERFADDRCLPPQFTALADAYWMLDSGVNVPRAVAILSDCRLNRDYATKTIHAISLAPNSAALIVQYVKTAKPLLVEPVDIDAYAQSLAETNFLEAWQFQKTFGETGENRARLLEKLLEWTISPEPRPQPLTGLLSFPFSTFEETFIHNYALEPPNPISQASLSALRDLLCVRLIQQGNYSAAIKLDHQFASSTINESKADSQDRRKMVKDIYEALPSIERLQLDLELASLSKTAANGKPPTGKPLTNGKSPSKQAEKDAEGDLTMSQSWEEIPRPSSVDARQTPPPVLSTSFRDIIPPAPSASIPERAGAPRFGGPSPIPPTQAPPIIPISAAPKPAAKPRQSFPFSGIGAAGGFSASPSTSTGNQSLLGGKPRQSFGQPLPFGLPNVPSGLGGLGGGGLKFPSSSTSGHKQQQAVASANLGAAGPSVKVPASRQQNAFYTPPAHAPPNPLKRTFAQSHVEHEPRAQKEFDAKMAEEREERELHEEEDEDREHQEHDAEKHEDVHMGDDEDDGHAHEERHQVDSDAENAFSYSVFSGQPTAPAAKPRRREAAESVSTKSTRMKKRTTEKTPARSARSKKILPGGLTSEDEDGAPPSPTTTRSGRSSRKAAPQMEEKPTRAQPTRAKKAKITRKSLPGALALTDDDDDDSEHDVAGDEENEAEDEVPPLRQPSPAPAVRKHVKKSRASATPDISDGEGPYTRRRSSRLSVAGSVSGEPTSPTTAREKKGKAKASSGSTKKSSASTAGTRRKK